MKVIPIVMNALPFWSLLVVFLVAAWLATSSATSTVTREFTETVTPLCTKRLKPGAPAVSW